MLSILGGVADFERTLIRERQREGIAVAKSRGDYRGRKCALTADQIAEIRSRTTARESKTTLAKEFNVSREPLYQALRTEYAVWAESGLR
jgi:DNA invertase Pin-like site-specific DNA recombinase